MTDIFVAEVGQLTGPSKSALRKAGIVVVEVQDLSKCEFRAPQQVVPANDLSWAAIHALNEDGGYANTGGHQRRKFVTNLLTVVAENTNRHG